MKGCGLLWSHPLKASAGSKERSPEGLSPRTLLDTAGRTGQERRGRSWTGK